jgi:hypothetical protein
MSQLVLPFLTGPRTDRATPRPPPAQPSSGAVALHEPQSGRSAALAPPAAAPPAAAAVPRRDLFLSAASALAARLSAHLDEAAEVELTDNAWTMVSYKRVEGLLRFRLHHMFGDADDQVVRALAGFTGKARRIHGRTIDRFIKENRGRIRATPARAQGPLLTRGRVHDLADIYDQLNAGQFDGKVRARIGWGRRAPGRHRRSIKMGVYLHEQQLIRIHPALDDERVPRLFVELVVFHEMLHQVIPPTEGEGGRRCVHSRAFREAEQRFPGYQRARAWEKQNLGLLLRSRG